IAKVNTKTPTTSSAPGRGHKILEEYFAAGLLHDIGKIPLNNALAEEYVRTMAVADRDRISLHVAEKRTLELDHAGRWRRS
ncbi:MAG: HDOD domain-containing protein, partial [Candidatus Moduliflexus flocculans]|nr:HDOD domain-containing protein [Candidatus Moduliflexus flocculans]